MADPLAPHHSPLTRVDQGEGSSSSMRGSSSRRTIVISAGLASIRYDEPRRLLVGAGCSGSSCGVVPPVPIPNTVVKDASADDTAGATPWDRRSLPGHPPPTR